MFGVSSRLHVFVLKFSMFFKSHKSPNFNDRAGDTKPSLVILHYTDMEGKEALTRLCDPESQVSAHYFIEESGKVLQLVKDKNRAWHAGKSYWQGEMDINSHSIGIELVNPGHSNGYRAFPDKQIAALVKLCKKLMKKYDIPPANILAHSDVAPARKQDPGHLFPWEAIAAQGVGLWPVPNEMDIQAAEDMAVSQDSLHELLIGYGYDPQAEFEEVMLAFHRHYYPEKFMGDESPEKPDILSCARLLALIRARHEG